MCLPEWELEYLGNKKWSISSSGLEFSKTLEAENNLLAAGPGAQSLRLFLHSSSQKLGLSPPIKHFVRQVLRCIRPQ